MSYYSIGKLRCWVDLEASFLSFIAALDWVSTRSIENLISSASISQAESQSLIEQGCDRDEDKPFTRLEKSASLCKSCDFKTFESSPGTTRPKFCSILQKSKIVAAFSITSSTKLSNLSSDPIMSSKDRPCFQS